MKIRTERIAADCGTLSLCFCVHVFLVRENSNIESKIASLTDTTTQLAADTYISEVG